MCSQTSDTFGTGHGTRPRVAIIQTWHWHVTTRTTPSRPHVFIVPECVNDSLILGVVVKQIAQRKEGMFP